MQIHRCNGPTRPGQPCEQTHVCFIRPSLSSIGVCWGRHLMCVCWHGAIFAHVWPQKATMRQWVRSSVTTLSHHTSHSKYQTCAVVPAYASESRKQTTSFRSAHHIAHSASLHPVNSERVFHVEAFFCSHRRDTFTGVTRLPPGHDRNTSPVAIEGRLLNGHGKGTQQVYNTNMASLVRPKTVCQERSASRSALSYNTLVCSSPPSRRAKPIDILTQGRHYTTDHKST
ncbi:hypothetical protein CC86DRAFT_72491 [Ophiobolus disseminans]|uniref:Uncharacterized protein n=1 Tax=Ophiobolus disseminans TaxID=1469910 RepID=A0A6A6ZNZ8_9PLEO|nr:hypothetical protein CC86DRAFT_72491 [Ophiobolus disseminans]